ncbi:MAG: natural product biosynthesis luciferase-like monooxygenase protein [Cellvibrionaceae bacterium]|jgi:natural product biosynthesis luciferase-like monooxygenase protein
MSSQENLTLKKKTFSCYLIGGDSLLIECGETLQSRGHEVRGVITNAPRLSQWAMGKSIPVMAADANYPAALAEKAQSAPFDYLFSITHLAIIKDEVLALPQKMTINFHDGPLPAYAGLNAPAWALMNQEEKYGISWHKVVSGVDEGELLKQEHFDIAAGETSLSINTKCFAAALESFPVLIDELVDNSTQFIEQDLSKRSYFAKFKRPDAMGLLDWDKGADALAAFVGALNFGEYPNVLTTPKILVNTAASTQNIFSVVAAVAQEQSASAEAGTVISVDDNSIDVATIEGVLSITQLTTLSGKKISLSSATICVGDRLNVLGPEKREALSEINQKLCRKDEYWSRRLATLDPIEIPYSNNESSAHARADDYKSIDIDITENFSSALGAEKKAFALAAVFTLLLARLGRKFEFDIALREGGALGSVTQASSLVGGLVSDRLAAYISVDTQTVATTLVSNIAQQFSEALEKGAWSNDIVGRYPNLHSLPELNNGTALPVAIALNLDSEDSQFVLGSAVTFTAYENSASLYYDTRRLSEVAATKLVTQYIALVGNMAVSPQQLCGEVELLSDNEKRKILEEWNQTTVEYDNSQCIHHLFEEQVIARPNATAVVFENDSVTYAELNQRANNLAALLIQKGVKADELVGVNVERSIDLMVATLGVMKAGAAYVPLDPAFPSDRIGYMVSDAKMRLIITQTAIEDKLPPSNAEVICVDDLEKSDQAIDNPFSNVKSSHLSYVIYTSGSTGNPKGVMVEHRNVVNFFLGMDERIEYDSSEKGSPGTWLAVTSLSFDISVLELFWTLTRGFKVVVYKEDRGAEKTVAAKKLQRQPMQFGLFMWGNDDAPGSSKYKLMIDGAKYFDENNFDAVWTPERHFSAFGGPYPNPAVTSAAIAAITKKIKIRSGSIVSPLHHPIRIAEDWAVVDNLSDGRVGLSFAAGWQPNDFVIMPENHKNNKNIMLEQIETVKKLWRGEKVAFKNPMGNMVDIVTLPRPVQKELPVWLTTAGNPESYRQAGAKGVNVLTHLLGQSVEEVTEKIRIYREARKDVGLDPAEGHVTLMLHTFIGESDDDVRELVREPMKDYLRSAMKLVLDFAWSFPAFKRPGGADSNPADIDLKSLTEEESETILDFAFDRYYESSGLFGTTETCVKMINRCKAAGVDEIACLLDFGVETEKVMGGLPLLKEVRDAVNVHSLAAADTDEEADFSLAAQLEQHNVTHFQCTPSMARMLCFDNEARTQLAKLKHMMVGGEAFPNSLANDLKSILTGRLTNMYGPTETTIWSTTQDVYNADLIPIGRPIANTDIFILDQNYQPVPSGVPGDLFIGGDGVVRGYLDRAELTAERFIKSPFDSEKRIYWTGDLAKYRDDGIIDFLGRVDHQVKIRGYRIELGEIEALLGKHDSVRDCVLLLREDTPGDQRLVAYVVPISVAPGVSELKLHLRKQLPEYMVPNDIVILDTMPLTPNGKLDRKQLPSPQGLSQKATAAYVEPEDELQKTIAIVWQESLQVDKVGMNDNFFDLGGHSLLIVRVHQQLKQRVDKPISLTDLYRFPTIRSLTEFLNNDDANASLKQSSDRAQRRRERMGLRKRGRK